MTRATWVINRRWDDQLAVRRKLRPLSVRRNSSINIHRIRTRTTCRTSIRPSIRGANKKKGRPRARAALVYQLQIYDQKTKKMTKRGSSNRVWELKSWRIRSSTLCLRGMITTRLRAEIMMSKITRPLIIRIAKILSELPWSHLNYKKDIICHHNEKKATSKT